MDHLYGDKEFHMDKPGRAIWALIIGLAVALAGLLALVLYLSYANGDAWPLIVTGLAIGMIVVLGVARLPLWGWLLLAALAGLGTVASWALAGSMRSPYGLLLLATAFSLGRAVAPRHLRS
jgi:hypothetical protein